MRSIARDARQGLRALVANPRYSVVAFLTIVLMVGGITTIYTLVNGVLLRPLPYPDSDRLVSIESVQPKAFGTNVRLADIFELRKARSVDAWAIYRPGYVTSVIDTRGEPVSVQDQRVSADIFPIFAIRMAAGRPLAEDDYKPGAPRVVVISDDLAQTLFGGAGDVLGKTLAIRKETATIVGVTAAGTRLPRNWLTYPTVYRPFHPVDDATNGFTVVARIAPGASLTSARAELTVLAAGLAAAHPDTHKDRTATATLLLDKIVGSFGRVLWIFFSAVSCVLLIGVGNLMSLQLARNGTREREIVVRTALGASRGRIVRQLIVESLILSIIGGAAGLALTWPAVDLIVSALPPGFPRADLIAIDLRVALFACGISALVGVIVAIVPALQASRVELAARLNEGGRSATLSARRSRVQRALIAIETAVALILLIGSALLGNSFQRLITRDAGMQEDDLWTVRATLPSRYRENVAQTAFWASALEQVRKLPGVQTAAVIVNDSGPLSGGDISEGGIVPEGFVGSPRDGLSVSLRRVSDNYFSTVGMRLIKGRPILASDVDGAEEVVVVNELTAASLWPGADPIGKRLRSRNRLRTVVGVVPTYRHARLDGEMSPQMFLPFGQQVSIASSAAIMIRVAPGDRQAATAAAGLLTNLEPEMQRSLRISSMADVRWRLLVAERFRMTVLMVFAASAVFLALVGIFGLVAYTVGERQREIALRVALGAIGRDVLRVVSREAIVPALAGLAIGVIAAALATRLISSYLVDIAPLDLPTFVASAALLAAAAAGASFLPARRALTINPVDALRHE
jgi:putative ABC transport system permease protein